MIISQITIVTVGLKQESLPHENDTDIDKPETDNISFHYAQVNFWVDIEKKIVKIINFHKEFGSINL